MVERIVIPVCMSVFPDVNATALFLCFSTFFYTLGFKNRAVAVSQTSLQRRRRYFDRSLEKSYVFWLERATLIILAFLERNPYHWYIAMGLFAISNTLYVLEEFDCWLLPILKNLVNKENGNSSRVMKEVEGDNNEDGNSSRVMKEVEGDNNEDGNSSRVMKEVEGDNNDDDNDYNSEDDDDSEDDDNDTTSLLEHHKDTVDALNEDRCKWEEENANLKSDMEELISQNEENALSLMNRFEDHCRKSMADKELLRGKLRAAKQSKKYYRGMIRELENMRLQLLEDNKQLVERLEEATMEADHYYTVLHNFDERCRSILSGS